MSRRQWTAVCALLFGLVAAVGGGITYSAYSHSTTGAGNRFAAGTVHLGDNDLGQAVLTLDAVQPGAVDTGCIQLSYTGTLPAAVRLYATSSGTLAPYLELTVTRGVDNNPNFDSCIGFVADTTDYLGLGGGVVYSGPLSSFAGSWDAGVLDPPSGPVESWTGPSEVRSYRLSVELADNVAAEGKAATTTFVWEARNQ